ncbi:MAG: hypothetical protein ACLT9P_00345 [Evtepia gabavorous]
MKQAIAAFLLCLSLVLGGVALAAHTLQEDAGQVAVTAISRQGDPAAAQGLVATQSCQYAQTLLWDLTIPLDRPAQSTTAFSAQRDVPAAANDDAGVYLRFPHQDATLSAEPGYFLDNLPTSPALGPLYEQVARRTPPGQTRTEILNPSQFLDAYPLQVTLDLAGQSPDYSQAETFESQFDPSAQEAFQAFFRFPFAPDTRWKVTVTKDQDGLPDPAGHCAHRRRISHRHRQHRRGAHRLFHPDPQHHRREAPSRTFSRSPGAMGSTGCAS